MKVTRKTKLKEDKSPRKHDFYKHVGKVGTTATTIIWLIDAETPHEGDIVYFVDESDHVHPDSNQCYMEYLGEHQLWRGKIDVISSDGYLFISKL